MVGSLAGVASFKIVTKENKRQSITKEYISIEFMV